MLRKTKLNDKFYKKFLVLILSVRRMSEQEKIELARAREQIDTHAA